MADIIVRDWLVGQLKPLLPSGYRIEKFQRIPDVISGPTAILRQERIGRQIIEGRTVPGGRIAGFTLTMTVDSQDIARSETKLDDAVVTMLNAIDDATNVRWTTAEKRILSETSQLPCYDIALEVPYQHNKE